MKPSDLPKDSRGSVRYSVEVMGKLKKEGWTIQKLFDWAIDQNAQIEVKSQNEQKEVSHD